MGEGEKEDENKDEGACKPVIFSQNRTETQELQSKNKRRQVMPEVVESLYLEGGAARQESKKRASSKSA